MFKNLAKTKPKEKESSGEVRDYIIVVHEAFVRFLPPCVFILPSVRKLRVIAVIKGLQV